MPYPAISLREAQARLTAPGSPFEMTQVEIDGRPTRVFKNAPPTLRHVFLMGRAHGEKPFLIYQDERATYEAFSLATLALAEHLAKLGVVKGDRVAIAMRNLPEWTVAFFAAQVLGAIATQLNAWWTGPELEYGLTDSAAKVAIIDAERLDRLASQLTNCPDLEHVLVSRAGALDTSGRLSHLEDVIGTTADWPALPDRPLPAVDLQPEDNATIFYTSGTTGKPKGALGTHRNSCTTVFARPFSVACAALRRGEPPPVSDPSAPQKGALLSVPLFHTTGCQSTLIPVVALGFKLALMRKFDAGEALKVIAREKLTGAGGVPTIAWQLLDHPDFENYDFSNFEGFAYGGAPAPAELVRHIKAKMPKSQISTAWGMTETSAAFTPVMGEDYEHKPDSVGPALPVCDIRIVGPDGHDVPVGERGELWVRGPNVVKGYWRKPEATEQTFGGGWLRTGDIGKLDEEGFCYILDRAKDMLIRGGENIYCIEVENALYEHPAVLDCAVIGIPHPTLGEEPGAIVTLKPGSEATEADLRAFVAARIAAFKVPVKIQVQREWLPRNANGKIMKRELKGRLG